MEEINLKTFIVPIIVLILFIGGIIGIVNWQRSQVKNSPELSVNLPDEKVETQEKEALISGKTDPANQVWINSEQVSLKEDGTFEKNVTLSEGDNKYEIKTENPQKETTTVTRVITKTGGEVAQTPATTPATSPATSPGTPTAGPAEGTLNESGPADLLWAGGLALIVLSTILYRRSAVVVTNSLKNNF